MKRYACVDAGGSIRNFMHGDDLTLAHAPTGTTSLVLLLDDCVCNIGDSISSLSVSAALAGSGVPSVKIGREGSIYFDIAAFIRYTKTAGAWVSGGSFAGPQGIQGIPGNNGSAGPNSVSETTASTLTAGLVKTAGALLAVAVAQTDYDLPTTAGLTTPTTGQTTTINILSLDQVVHLDHAATIAAHTIVFPPNATSRIGQFIRVYSRSIVTALTLTTTGLTIRGAALTALTANGNACWYKTAASTWARVQ